MAVAQSRVFDLCQADARYFGKNLYCYGLIGGNTKTSFCVYKLDPSLQKSDSLIVDLGNSKVNEYLQTSSDTLHDFLNIYVQKKDKSVTVFRFNKQFVLVARVPDVEVARLNNNSIFKNAPYYFENLVYAVNIQSDSLGKQFYVNKYQLKSDSTNFEYEFKWQFPFERKNIQAARVFHVNSEFTYIYVIVNDGPKAGEWILKLNSKDGKLAKATKIGENGETSNYMYGQYLIDNKSKSLLLAGQKLSASQLNLKAGKLNIVNSASVSVYLVCIDSLGEVTRRHEFKFPINNVVSGAKKQSNGYTLRIKKMYKNPAGKIALELDIYKVSGQSLCFFYSNTMHCEVDLQDEQAIPEKLTVAPNILLESYYLSNDPLDENGKICIESAQDFDRFYFKIPTRLVNLDYKSDEQKNSHWVLSKWNAKKNTVNFSVLGPQQKSYLLKNIEDIPGAFNPKFISVSATNLILSTQVEETKFQLKAFNW